MSKSLKRLAYDTIEAHQETISDLRTQLAKANEVISKLESESLPDGYIAVPSEAWHEQCQYEARLTKANERVKELERFQEEVGYRCFLAGLNTEKPKESNGENEATTAKNHFDVVVDNYARGAARYVLGRLRKEQASD